MIRAARVAAQAKINLWLHVGGVDPEGYHEVFTLFHRIDLADHVVVRTRDDTQRSCVHSGGPADLGPPERNLAWRAAVAFQGRAGWPVGFDIQLEKHIPVGGGLGGGSADAGAVLRALNAIAPSPLPQPGLLALAAGLGSDVPFLTTEGVLAVGQGRGERLADCRSALAPADVLLVMPDFGIPTADAYGWLDEDGPRSLDATVGGPAGEPPVIERWEDADLGNDFEPAVESRYPHIRELRDRLGAAGATIARLSGSGSTVFGVFAGGAPASFSAPSGASVVRTRTSARVVPVEVLE